MTEKGRHRLFAHGLASRSSWHVRDVTPGVTRAAAIEGAADIPRRSPFMLPATCRTLEALSCSDPYLTFAPHGGSGGAGAGRLAIRFLRTSGRHGDGGHLEGRVAAVADDLRGILIRFPRRGVSEQSSVAVLHSDRDFADRLSFTAAPTT